MKRSQVIMNERISIADKKPEVKSQNLAPQIRRKTESFQSMNSAVERILFLQRTIGNQAVARLIKSGTLKAKLSIGQPGDIYEQEADRVAEQGMRMPDVPKGKDTRVQRKCPKCLKGLTGLMGKDKKDEKLQTKETPGQIPEVTPQIETSIDALKGGGQPLPESTRAFFEPRFGADFSNVRVHEGGHAGGLAEALQARAFTAGRDIVFGSGLYSPGTSDGRILLAHELTHVVQQGDSRVSPVVQRACGDADIGTQSGCTPDMSEPVGDLVLFKVGCDDFASPAERRKVEDFSDSMTASDHVNVHGFASADGNAAFNEQLSCARAIRALSLIQSRGVQASKIRLLKHGPTPGAARQRRSVVLERTPGVSRLAVPQLHAMVTTGPTVGICGESTFIIRWSLSRNSSTNGGFVIQDVTFRWSVRDCNGAAVPNPDPRTSPLHYFEAWRVPPNSTSPNATAFTVDTDRFFWPGNAPWAGGCTSGEMTISGIARYHNNLAALPAHMAPFNPSTFANDLLSSTTDPNLGGDVSRSVNHRLRLRWRCCPCQSSPTVVVDHTP